MGLDDQFDWFHDTWISSIQFIHENDDGNTSLSDLVISAEYLDQSGAREKYNIRLRGILDITGDKFCTINLILRVRVLEAGSYVVENLNGLLCNHLNPDRSKFEELLIFATKHDYKLFELDATLGLTIVALCKDVVVEKVELIE